MRRVQPRTAPARAMGARLKFGVGGPKPNALARQRIPRSPARGRWGVNLNGAMSTEPTRPRLDANVLARLQELDPDGRHHVLHRVLEAFETSLVRMLAQLGPQAPAPQPLDVSRMAHTLKSSAASVGALTLSQRCAEIEKKRRDGDAVGIEADVAVMVAEAESALVAVRAILRP